jgi:TRAP transporter TAXI family solute receptor
MRSGVMQWMGKLVAAMIVLAVVVFAGVESLSAWKADASEFFSFRQTVRVATAQSADGSKLLAALHQEIASQHARVQLSFVETPSVWASAQALHEQKVDAAVVRSDDAAAADGRTIFVLKSLHVALLAPAQASADAISKLKGKKIGVVTGETGIDPMAKAVLDFYGFDEKHIVRLSLKELADSLQRKQAAAWLVIGPTGAGPIADAIDAFRKATKRPPKFLDISEAKAIADRFAVYDEDEITAGAFGGSPALPAEKVTTISANLLLVSRASLSNYAAGELTRLLLATKSKVAATLPGAAQLAAPSTDKDELRPAHPGTIAFLSGEQSDLLDRSTNLILLSSMLTGFLGSVAAWLNGLRTRRKSHELKRRMRRLPMLLARASACGPQQLDAIEQELAALSEWLAQKFMANEISQKDFHNAEARLAHVKALVQRNRTCASLDQLEHFFGQWQSSTALVGAR